MSQDRSHPPVDGVDIRMGTQSDPNLGNGASDRSSVDISVVLPVYNERENLDQVFRETRDRLEEVFTSWEVVFVDDGSTDGSYNRLRALHDHDDHVIAVKFPANFGQSAAIDAGLRHAKGRVIVTMDADGQNDPADIPRLVETLNRGEYDCVVGWRRTRHDPFTKRAASKTAYGLRRIFLNTDLHDYGCTLKAFTREAGDAVQLKGEMHRYIPPLLTWRGFDVGEIEVNHRERNHGETKYSWQRLPKGFIDLINVWFWRKYSSRPLHIFGGLGIVSGLIGLLGGVYSVFLKVVHAVSLSDTALPLFAVFMCLLGIQFFISGILADISVKNYFGVQGTDPYRVDEVLDERDADYPSEVNYQAGEAEVSG